MEKKVIFNICDIIQVIVFGNGYVQSVIQQNLHNFRSVESSSKLKTLNIYTSKFNNNDNDSSKLYIEKNLGRKAINSYLFSAIRKILISDGFVLIHGSLLKNDNGISLYSGSGGAGKTIQALKHLINKTGYPLCDDIAIIGNNTIIPLPRYFSLGPKEYKYAKKLGFIRHQNIFDELFVKISLLLHFTFLRRVFPFKYSHFLWDNNQRIFNAPIIELHGVNSIEGLLNITENEWPLQLTEEEFLIQIKCLKKNIKV